MMYFQFLSVENKIIVQPSSMSALLHECHILLFIKNAEKVQLESSLELIFIFSRQYK